MSDTLEIDYAPISEFRYNQISNYEYQFLLIDKNNKALHTPFECKDYLQDIFYCEYVKKNSNIYGISWKPGMLDIDVEYFRVVLMGGREELEGKIPALQKFINVFDSAQGIPLSKVYPTTNPKNIVVEFHKLWTENGPKLSAYMTLLRLWGAYTEEEDVLEYLKKIIKELRYDKFSGPLFMRKDIYNLSIENRLGRLAALLAGVKVQHNWSDFSSIEEVHDTGLMEYEEFPTVEVS